MRRPVAVAVSVLIASCPAIALETKGFEAAHDEAMVQELARHGMDQVLDRYFTLSGASADRQASVRAMMSIRKLLTEGASLSDAQRQTLVREITAGADAIVPTLQDPRQLMQLASALITGAMERTANTMEYWGENPNSQAELRPVADLVAKVLATCEQRAREQAEALVARFGNNPPQAQLKAYAELDHLATTASYTRYMSDYYRAMSLPKSDPRRASIAEEAIAALAEFDNEESKVQALVRLRIGKLHMVKGDLPAAQKLFAGIAQGDGIQPPPDVLQQFEARYFAAVASALAGDADGAAGQLKELESWQEKSLPQDKGVRAGASASLAMLEYRIEAQRAELAAAADKPAAQARANAVLQELAQSRPELRGVIFGQLVKSLPQDAPVSGLDSLMLKALVQQGMAEKNRAEGEPVNKAVLERAIAAGEEFISRTDPQDAAVRDDVAIVLPQLLEKLGHDDAAARAFLRYAQEGKNAANRPAAMSYALAAIERLKAANTNLAEVQRLSDEALALAVKNFDRRDLAYDLARRLHERDQYSEAIAMYRIVPREDARAMVADFHRMQAMKQEVDAGGAQAERSEPIRRLAHELSQQAAAARAAAQDEASKTRAGLIDARARLMLGDLAKQKEPANAVKALEGFEEVIAGLPGVDDLQAEALLIRIQSLMASGRNTEATESLLQLLQSREGGQGAAMIFNLLKRLDQDLDDARRTGSTARAQELLSARAALSGPLVEWARNNKEERIRKYTYQYMVFDAVTKQQAAMAEPDVPRRVAALREVLGLYDKLLDGNNIKLWAATVDPAKVDVAYGDVAVLFAKAQVLYELADYRQASQRFGRLLEDRKLGMARTVEVRDGEVVNADNPQYWEATYKLYQSNIELSRDPATPNRGKLLEETANGLKQLYIREGDGVGGEKWKRQFEQLRKEIIRDWRE